MAYLSLLDDASLSPAERSDVLSGTNAIDITLKFSNLLAHAATLGAGTIIDATAWHGTVVWTSDPFSPGGSTIPVIEATLRTGAVTFEKNFNDGPIMLPSKFHWEMSETAIRPTIEITTIPTNATPAHGMIMTYIGSVALSAVSTSSVTLTYPSSAAGILPGARLSLEGIRDFPAVTNTLLTAITSSSTSLKFGDPTKAMNTMRGSFVYVKIGSEVISGQVSADGTQMTSLSRARVGTVANGHPSAAPITLRTAQVNTVVSVSGSTVTLAGDPLPSFGSHVARVGSLDTKISGAFTIDGEYNFGGAASYVYFCITSVLSERFTVFSAAELMNAPHGGIMLMSCTNASITGKSITDCSRVGPPGLGGAVWGFGGGERNYISFDTMSGGHAGILSDNKSFDVPLFALIDGERRSLYRIGEATGMNYVADFTGTTENTLVVDTLGTGVAMPSFYDSLSSQQTTSSVHSSGNVAVIHSTSVTPAKGGSDAALNTVVVNGTVVP